jgi:hypothetical protein
MSDLFASWMAWATKAGEYVGAMKRFLASSKPRASPTSAARTAADIEECACYRAIRASTDAR